MIPRCTICNRVVKNTLFKCSVCKEELCSRSCLILHMRTMDKLYGSPKNDHTPPSDYDGRNHH